MIGKVTLFALPFAGGSKYSYNTLKSHFPHSLLFNAIELPGRGVRIKEPLKVNMHEFVEDVYQQIEGRLNEPYAIYGHSMGSTLGYLLIKKIAKKKKELPLHLFVSGRGGPSCIEKRRRYLLPKIEFREVLTSLGGIPQEVAENNILMDFFEPILRADFQAIETFNYTPSPVEEIPITVFIGNDDKVSVDDAMKWQDETTIPIDLKRFSGGHFFIFDHSKRIADVIAETLEVLP